MQANYVQRLRLTFSKTGPARYIGHLDLSRTLERSFNRARIPIAYTQGFNRRPRMSLAAALPLGFTSDFELVDIWLAEEMEPDVAQETMMRKMAPGIRINQVEQVPLSEPSLQSSVTSAAYRVYLLSEMSNLPELQEGIAGIFAVDTLPIERKRGKGKVKKYDLRPLIIELKLENENDERGEIFMELRQSQSETGRPDDVLSALNLDPYETIVHRTKITLESF